MRLIYTAFRGEIPILDPRLLPDQAAQTAENVYLRRGTLKPEKGAANADGSDLVNTPRALFRYPHGNDGDGWWLSWDNRVHAVASPLADDDYQRIYWTGDGAPKMGGIDILTSSNPPYPNVAYALGIPSPNGIPAVSAPDNRVFESDQPDTALDTAYVVTLVSTYGEEGPPSNPSSIIARWDMVDDAPDGGEVEVSLPEIPSGDHDIVTKRLYRVESGGIYQRVADLDASADTYTDDVLSEELGAGLQSEGWTPPDSRMEGLTSLPGGILAGFFDNTLCFCVAYRPHAWPVDYQLAFPEYIVAIEHTAAGLVVTTEGRPYLVTGSSPDAMVPIEIDSRQPCVSADSLIDMGDYALYAANDGLVAVGGREAQVVTREVMSRAQWRDLDPSTIHGFRFDGDYLGFYAGGAFRFSQQDGFTFFSIEADAGYYDLAADRLYLIDDDSLIVWNEGDPLTMTWRSRIHEVPPGDAGLTCGKVIAAKYPVTLRLIADGNTVFEEDIEKNQVFRLPDGNALAREWEVEVQSRFEVRSVQLASSPSELV
jgi:hypothetical protein